MNLKTILKNCKFCLRFLIIFQLIFSSTPVFSQEKNPSSLTHKQLDELKKIFREGGKQTLVKHPYMESIDPYRLLGQEVQFANEEGNFTGKNFETFLYDADRDSFDKEVVEVKIGTNDKKIIYLEGLFDGIPVVRQYLNIGEYIHHTSDVQFKILLTNKGLFVVDTNMAISVIGHAPLPVVPLMSRIRESQYLSLSFISNKSVFTEISQKVREQLESKSENKSVSLRTGDLVATKGDKVVTYVEREFIEDKLVKAYHYVDLTLTLSKIMRNTLRDPQKVSRELNRLGPKDEKIFDLITQSLEGGTNHLGRFKDQFEDYLDHLRGVSVESAEHLSVLETQHFEGDVSKNEKIFSKMNHLLRNWGPLAFIALAGPLFLGIPSSTFQTSSFGTYSYTVLTLGVAFFTAPLIISHFYEWVLKGFSKLPRHKNSQKKADQELQKLTEKSSLKDRQVYNLKKFLNRFKTYEPVINLGQKARLQKTRIDRSLERASTEGYFIRRWIVLFPILQQVAAVLSLPFWERAISMYYRFSKRPYVHHFRKKGYSIDEINKAVDFYTKKSNTQIERSFNKEKATIRNVELALDEYQKAKSQLENKINNLIFSIASDPKISNKSLGVKKINRQEMKKIVEKIEKDPVLGKQILWAKNILDLGIEDLLFEERSEKELVLEISERVRKSIQEYNDLLNDQNRTQAFLEKLPLKTRLFMKKILKKVVSHPQEVHQFLMGNTAPFHARRSGMEYLTDQLALVLLTPFIVARSNYGGMFDSSITQLYPYSSSGTSEQGFSDATNNAFLHLFFASMMTALSLKPDTSIQTLQERVNESYESRLEKGKQEGFLEHIKHRFSYFTKWGIDGNLGEIAIKREKAMYIFALQSVFLFFLIPRVLSGELTLLQSVASFLIFSGYSLPAYRWFWGWVSGGAQYEKNRLAHNKKLMSEILNGIHRIRQGSWIQNQEASQKLTEKIISHVEELYGKKISESIAIDLESLKTLEVDAYKDAVFNRIENNLNSKYPSTLVNNKADWVMTTFLGPIVTSILGTVLYVWTFDSNLITASNLFLAGTVYATTIGVLSLWKRPLWKNLVGKDGTVKESWATLSKAGVKNLVSKVKLPSLANMKSKLSFTGSRKKVASTEGISQEVEVQKVEATETPVAKKKTSVVQKTITGTKNLVSKVKLPSLKGVTQRPIAGVKNLVSKVKLPSLKGVTQRSVAGVKNLVSKVKIPSLKGMTQRPIAGVKNLVSKVKLPSLTNMKSKLSFIGARKEVASTEVEVQKVETTETPVAKKKTSVVQKTIAGTKNLVSKVKLPSLKGVTQRPIAGVKNLVSKVKLPSLKGMTQRPIAGVKNLVSKVKLPSLKGVTQRPIAGIRNLVSKVKLPSFANMKSKLSFIGSRKKVASTEGISQEVEFAEEISQEVESKEEKTAEVEVQKVEATETPVAKKKTSVVQKTIAGTKNLVSKVKIPSLKGVTQRPVAGVKNLVSKVKLPSFANMKSKLSSIGSRKKVASTEGISQEVEFTEEKTAEVEIQKVEATETPVAKKKTSVVQKTIAGTKNLVSKVKLPSLKGVTQRPIAGVKNLVSKVKLPSLKGMTQRPVAGVKNLVSKVKIPSLKGVTQRPVAGIRNLVSKVKISSLKGVTQRSIAGIKNLISKIKMPSLANIRSSVGTSFKWMMSPFSYMKSKLGALFKWTMSPYPMILSSWPYWGMSSNEWNQQDISTAHQLHLKKTAEVESKEEKTAEVEVQKVETTETPVTKKKVAKKKVAKKKVAKKSAPKASVTKKKVAKKKTAVTQKKVAKKSAPKASATKKKVAKKKPAVAQKKVAKKKTAKKKPPVARKKVTRPKAKAQKKTAPIKNGKENVKKVVKNPRKKNNYPTEKNSVTKRKIKSPPKQGGFINLFGNTPSMDVADLSQDEFEQIHLNRKSPAVPLNRINSKSLPVKSGKCSDIFPNLIK